MDRGLSQEVLGRTLGDDDSSVDHGHPVADPFHFGQQMAVEEDGHAPPAQMQEHVAHVEAPQGVEGAGGLVEEDQLGVAHQRLGQAEPLLHALGVLAYAAVAGGADAHQVEQGGGVHRRAREPAVELQQLSAGEPGGEAEELGQVAHAALHRPGARPAAEHLHLPFAAVAPGR